MRPRRRRSNDRQRHAHLDRQASLGEADRMGEFGVEVGRFEHPPVHAAASLGGDHAKRFGEQFRADRRHFIAVVG